MIAAVRGQLEGRGADHALVGVGGIVLRISSSTTTLQQLGAVGTNVTLHTHLWVREEALLLFGFSTIEELRLFETLLGVTGVGPRLALNILSFAGPDQIQAALLTEDTALLSKVPGVGRKTAARIILDLRGKLTAAVGAGGAGIPADTGTNEVIEALQALGYSGAEAVEALRMIGEEGRDLTVEQRVFAALRHLGSRR